MLSYMHLNSPSRVIEWFHFLTQGTSSLSLRVLVIASLLRGNAFTHPPKHTLSVALSLHCPSAHLGNGPFS